MLSKWYQYKSYFYPALKLFWTIPNNLPVLGTVKNLNGGKNEDLNGGDGKIIVIDWYRYHWSKRQKKVQYHLPRALWNRK